MCGIAGIISSRGVDMASLRAMSSAVAHRGPNGYGYAFHSPEEGVQVWHNTEPEVGAASNRSAGLAFRRLSVIDLSDRNMQPMTNPEKTVALTYNGEIYNYLELRKELEGLGHT